MPRKGRKPGQGFLGIDAGATRTTALWRDYSGAGEQRLELGPANLQLISDRDLGRHLRAIASALPVPRAIAIGMAGTRTESDRERLRRAARTAWPDTPCLATHDLAIALAAATPAAGTASREHARILVLSGTGSCCYGTNVDGEEAKTGGWGHLLGDHGSAYHIALTALQRTIVHFENRGTWPRLGAVLLAAVHLNEPDALITWARSASKAEVAALAPDVFSAAMAGDALARGIIEEAADALADTAIACARRLARPGQRIRFILAGGVLVHQPLMARRTTQAIRRQWRSAKTQALDRAHVEGAVILAREHWAAAQRAVEVELTRPLHRAARRAAAATDRAIDPRIPQSVRPAPTEERNPRSLRLDRLSVSAAVELFLEEDANVANAVRAEKPRLMRAVQLIRRSLSGGGRLFYVGAGTSGRLGVLDASECPPTFRTPPEMVQGIIEAGAQAIRFRGITARDVVVGIAASGRTPFVWGALTEAAQRGAATILVCSHPFLRFAPGHRPTVVIAPNTGPEILTGSTRLKAGTAAKLILNLFTTLAMVGLGKVRSNLMIDLNPANRKLRDRAVRITCTLAGVDVEKARAALEAAGWVVKRALENLLSERASRRR
jgi:N-acetylmuramic acid 6-phosphate etherase